MGEEGHEEGEEEGEEEGKEAEKEGGQENEKEDEGGQKEGEEGAEKDREEGKKGIGEGGRQEAQEEENLDAPLPFHSVTPTRQCGSTAAACTPHVQSQWHRVHAQAVVGVVLAHQVHVCSWLCH